MNQMHFWDSRIGKVFLIHVYLNNVIKMRIDSLTEIIWQNLENMLFPGRQLIRQNWAYSSNVAICHDMVYLTFFGIIWGFE